MKLFLSWSGEKSRLYADALRRWLPNVHQRIELFFSPSDIEKGAKWAAEIDSQLRDTRFCIVCLTSEAALSTWINFEAGAISKGIGQNRVVPILFDISKPDVSGPLSLFQLSDFGGDELKDIVKAINAASDEDRIGDEILLRAFDRWWPDLEKEVVSIRTSAPEKKAPSKSTREITEEILLNTRELMKQVSTQRPNRDRRVLAHLVRINQLVAGMGRTSILEESESFIKRLRPLSREILSLNEKLGKTVGPSLVLLKHIATELGVENVEPARGPTLDDILRTPVDDLPTNKRVDIADDEKREPPAETPAR
jgi:hypothetical protein